MIAKRVRLLVLRGGALGDFIATLPALRALRARWPDAYIELIGYPHIARLALEGSLVDKVDSLDRAGIAKFFALTPSFTAAQVSYIRSFDLVLCYLHDPDGSVLNNLQLAGAKQVIYGSPIVEEGSHAVDHLLKPLETLAIYESGVAPKLRLDPDQRAWGADLLKTRGVTGRAYMIHPGSGSARKNWPVDHFEALADRLRAERGAAPLFLLGEAEGALGERLRRYTVFTDLSLLQAAALISACHAYIGNDSGITHMAAALGLPVTALFGPSLPEQWGPRGERVRIVTADSSDITRIDPETVWRALGSIG